MTYIDLVPKHNKNAVVAANFEALQAYDKWEEEMAFSFTDHQRSKLDFERDNQSESE